MTSVAHAVRPRLLLAIQGSLTGCGCLKFIECWLVTLTVTSTAWSQQVNPAEVFERLRPSIVKIESFGGTHGDVMGTGFVVDGNGVIATNWHVVDGAKAVRITLESGDIFDEVALVDSDLRRDLAVLKVKAVALHPVIIGDSDAIRPGERILAIGHSAGLTNTITEGLVSGIRRAEEVPELRATGYQVFQISSPIWHGASGGVVLNQRSEVVAIPYAGLTQGQNINFAIPSKYLTPLISQNVKSFFATAENKQPTSVSAINSSILSAIEPAIPPAELLNAKTAFVGYISGHRPVFENLPSKLRDWKRWKLVSDEKEADILLVYYQSGTDGLGDDQLTLAVVNKSGRKLLSVNCLRRLSSGYTAGVLVNRLKKRLEDAEKKK